MHIKFDYVIIKITDHIRYRLYFKHNAYNTFRVKIQVRESGLVVTVEIFCTSDCGNIII